MIHASFVVRNSCLVLLLAQFSKGQTCYNDNSNCGEGEFCNQDDETGVCEKCYYPCDLDQPDAIDRYEAVCGPCGAGPTPVSRSPVSKSPVSSRSPASSPGPTPCNKEVDWEVKTSPNTNTPLLLTPRSTFPATNAFCTIHESYMNCTNESREDCQWVFLSGSSSRGGVCRVDPVSKCIETGSCTCNTDDFQGGGTDLGDGIIFHAPVSVTARDISSNAGSVSFTETYTPPTNENQNQDHPHDETFFISRVDFSHRDIHYTFAQGSPVPTASKMTVAFKLHYLYMDIPVVGAIWSGLGLEINMDTSGVHHTLTVNGNTYNLAVPLKKWHCTQIAVTSAHFYVAGNKEMRNLSAEKAPQFTTDFHLGKLSGEIFDVRIYDGSLSSSEIDEIGARCTNPNNPAVLNLHKDIETPILRGGCDPDIDPIPTTGGQTYSSGPFATFWIAPIQDEFDKNIYHDIPEGSFDDEHTFQQAKMQSYAWEKWYFETDMVGFNQKPYRFYNSADEVRGFSKDVWDNPCRYIHQHNNGWLFPFYGGDSIPKWTDEEHVFDLGYLFHNRGFDGYGFVVHEAFHGMQGELADTYGSPYGRFFAESTASFGADTAFPATQTYSSPYTLAHALPLNYFFDRDAQTNPHFQTTDISINDSIRGGHIYAAFLFWSFLSNHVGIPHIIGKLHSIQGKIFDEVFGGELLALRIFVESEGFDLGDLFGIFVAHLRTWDYPRFADSYVEMEQNDFKSYSSNEEWPFLASKTLESLKTDVVINPDRGTSGNFVFGPEVLRPGQFGWNCLTAKNVGVGKFVTLTIVWSGLGRDSSNPSALHEKQSKAGCDDDVRFYNSMVVAHNLQSGERRYWKLKGKSPPKLVIDVGSSAPVTIHILMVPTPPADYVDSRVLLENDLPVPAYSYKYKIEITETEPTGGSNPPADMQNGIAKFESSTDDWWSTRCTCTVLGDDLSTCSVPRFDNEEKVCRDDPEFAYQAVTKKNCKWVAKSNKIIKLCKKKPIKRACQIVCGVCCTDDPAGFQLKGKNKKCGKFLAPKKKKKKNCRKVFVNTPCAFTCGRCCYSDQDYTFLVKEKKKGCLFINTPQKKKKFCKDETEMKCGKECGCEDYTMKA